MRLCEVSGFSVHLHDHFAAQPHPFYAANARHVLAWWAALLLLAVVFFGMTLCFQQRKDGLR